MSPHARYQPSMNSDPSCSDFMTMADRELSAFFNAIIELFGYEQAQLSAEDWLQELAGVSGLPASTGEWRSITTKASSRLASRVSASRLSLSLSTEFTNA